MLSETWSDHKKHQNIYEKSMKPILKLLGFIIVVTIKGRFYFIAYLIYMSFSFTFLHLTAIFTEVKISKCKNYIFNQSYLYDLKIGFIFLCTLQ